MKMQSSAAPIHMDLFLPSRSLEAVVIVADIAADIASADLTLMVIAVRHFCAL